MGALVAAYLEYASLGLTLAALHLNLFEQPGLPPNDEPQHRSTVRKATPRSILLDKAAQGE
jgi:hypothetical protein